MPITVIPPPNAPDPTQQLGQLYEMYSAMQLEPLKRQMYEAQIASAQANQAQSMAAAEASRADAERTRVVTGQEQFKLDTAKTTRENQIGALKSAVNKAAAANPALAPIAAAVPASAASVEELPIELQDPVGTMLFTASPANRAWIAANEANIRQSDASALASRASAAESFARARALAENPASDSKATTAALGVVTEDRKELRKSLANLNKDYLGELAKIETSIVGGPKQQALARQRLDAMYLPRIKDAQAALDDTTKQINALLRPVNERLKATGVIQDGPTEDDAGPELAQKVNPAQMDLAVAGVRERFLTGDTAGAMQQLQAMGVPLETKGAVEWADRNLQFLPRSSPQRKILTQTLVRLAGLTGGQLTLEGIRKTALPAMDISGKGFAYPGRQIYESDIRGYLPLPSELYPETSRSPRAEREALQYGVVMP